MSDTFCLDQDSDVIIYGAAALGTLVYRNICSACRVVAFFDKRGDELEACMGLPVYQPEQAPFTREQRKQLVVVLAIKNIFEHEFLANRLMELGYERLIFKAADRSIFGKKGMVGLVEIGHVFDCIVDGELDIGRDIPLSRRLFQVEWYDYALLRKEHEHVIAYIPVVDVSTNIYPDPGYMWNDVPVAALFPHLEFFGFLSGRADCNSDFYVDDFITYTAQRNSDYRVTDRWKENVIQNRTMVYEQMNLAWELDRDFFVRNAPTAKFNLRGGFNLTSGKHRSTFLAAKECRFIPLSISPDDYECYLNARNLQVLTDHVESLDGRPLPMPVIHPYFYYYPCAMQDAFYSILVRLMRFLGKYLYTEKGDPGFAQLRIMDISRHWRGLGLHLSRNGACVVQHGQWSELEAMVAALYRLPHVLVEDEAGADYDLLITDEVEHSWSGKARFCLVIEEASRLTSLQGQLLMRFFLEGKAHSAVLVDLGASCP